MNLSNKRKYKINQRSCNCALGNLYENNDEKVKIGALRHIDRRNFGERLDLVDVFVYALVKAGDV